MATASRKDCLSLWWLKPLSQNTTKIAYFVGLFRPAVASHLADVIQERNGWTGERVVAAKAQWWMGKPRLAQVIWSNWLGSVAQIIEGINAACDWKESDCRTQLCVVLECMAEDQLGAAPCRPGLANDRNYKLDNNKKKSLDDPISCTSVSPSPQTALFYDSKTEKMDRK